ncbi:MAG: hypothetical protein QOF73_5154 [Thermomicrobiales bacterium]|nr:hypothetical protein [Thermomicrobiales bacterium]
MNERGVYFDAWFPRQHCYHPSLPPRRLRMVDDLREYRATSLVWSALGGGSIALPYLEEEAFGEIDPRFRFYGFVNDAEFIAECRKNGIKVFGIVFEVQGWEFPAELSEDEDRVLALNELRGVGKRGWLGLREFSQNRYPKLWPPFEHYFPGGLVNSAGEPVTDLLEEGCSRDIYGVPCHAHWVECPDREHFCYTMDRNNPVWREYLKAITRIQIAAGVDGVQLDEAELPLTTLQYGGCFCKDCMKGFRAYLQELSPNELPTELAGTDLATFHYGSWLLERGYDFKSNREDTPLFWRYLAFQRRQITRYFAELADYAREHAASKGRTVLVSGNFFNLLDQYYALEPKVDLIITEMRNTNYRQPVWYRYVAGFAGPKPVIVVENPYGGIIPKLVAKLKLGKGYDLFRMSLYEAAALGANMSVPYGAWLGSIEEDSFWAPHDLCVEIQSFLADNEHLFSRSTYHEVGVVFSVESNFRRVARRDQFANNRLNVSGNVSIPFWDICDSLSNAAHPYDVVFFPDGELRPDTLTVEDLLPYRTLILPDCHILTPAQAKLIAGYLEQGGHVLVWGEFAANLPDADRQRIVEHPGVRVAEIDAPFSVERVADGPQVLLDESPDLALCIQRVARGAAVHLIRYDYDEESDATPVLPELTIEVRLPNRFERLAIHSPVGEVRGELTTNGDVHRLVLRDVPLYCVAVLESAD